jgi:hypothetical protein
MQFFDVISLAPGQLLFEKDDVPSDSFYIILEVRVGHGTKHIINIHAL